MTDAAGGAVQTPMRDHVEHFWRLLREGKVRILVDTECPGFGGAGWYASSSFGDDVAKALAEQRAELIAALLESEEAVNAALAMVEHDHGAPNWDWLREVRERARAALARTTRPAAKGEG